MPSARWQQFDTFLTSWLPLDADDPVVQPLEEAGRLGVAHRLRRRQLHARRAPLAYSIFLFFGAVATGIEIAAYPARWRIALAAFAAFACICIATIALIRARPQWTTVAAVVSNNLLVLCCALYYVPVRGTPEACAMTLVLLLAALSLLNGAGALVQALSCLGALISYPIVVFYAGPAELPLAYGVTAILGAAAVTIFGAHLLDLQRYAAFRSREALRASEARLRRVSERYRALYDHNPAMYFTVDAGGTVRSVNRFGAQQLGYRVEELVGHPVVDVIHPADRDDFRAQLLRCVQRPGELAHWQFRKVRKDGSVLWVEELARGVDDGRGRIEVFIVCDDVTQRNQAEAAARSHQAELAHVARVSLMGGMAAELAHEINQPLAAIVNFTRGCERRLRAGGTADADMLDALAQVSDQALRAGEIIRRIRNFIRKEEPSQAWVDVNELVRNVVELAEPEARQNAIRVHLALAPGLPRVYVNSIQIEQVLLNLVRNAFDAMHGDTVGAKALSICTCTTGGTPVEIAVSDTGGGLSPELLERIFDPFFTTKPSGLGLGLSISRSIIEAHGGRLWAECSADGGCTFRLHLAIDDPVQDGSVS